MKKGLVGFGGVFAAVGAAAAYYFHTATYEAQGEVLGIPFTYQETYDPIWVAVSIGIAILGIAILAYGSLAETRASN